MKSLKISFFILLSTAFFVSCKKNDINYSPETSVESKPAVVLSNKSDISNWKSSSQWTTIDQENFNIYYTTFSDSSITADVADNGMLLVFKKDGDSETAVALPFEDKSVENSSYYWYYQVSEGTLLITCDAYGSAKKPDMENNFKYVVLSKDDLTKLEGNGFSRAKLMSLSMEEVNAFKVSAQ